jgi:hypothetical protein
MDLKKVAWMDVDWTDLPQDRDKWRVLVNTAKTFGLTNCGTVSFLRTATRFCRRCNTFKTTQFMDFVLFVFYDL